MDPASSKILEISRINLMFSWLSKSVGGAEKKLQRSFSRKDLAKHEAYREDTTSKG